MCDDNVSPKYGGDIAESPRDDDHNDVSLTLMTQVGRLGSLSIKDIRY